MGYGFVYGLLLGHVLSGSSRRGMSFYDYKERQREEEERIARLREEEFKRYISRLNWQVKTKVKEQQKIRQKEIKLKLVLSRKPIREKGFLIYSYRTRTLEVITTTEDIDKKLNFEIPYFLGPDVPRSAVARASFEVCKSLDTKFRCGFYKNERLQALVRLKGGNISATYEGMGRLEVLELTEKYG